MERAQVRILGMTRQIGKPLGVTFDISKALVNVTLKSLKEDDQDLVRRARSPAALTEALLAIS